MKFQRSTFQRPEFKLTSSPLKQLLKMGFEKVILKAGASGKRAVKGNSVTVHCTGMLFNPPKSGIIPANKKSFL
jgi:hypothetical protein